MDVIPAGHPEAVARTAGCMEAGGIVVLPTDTVYGLAVRPGDDGALERLYQLKGRPLSLNLPVFVGSLAEVDVLGVEVSDTAKALAERFWPGAMTIVFGFSPGASRPAWLAGRSETAVRVPDHSFPAALVARTGPLLVTSANLHGEATPAAAVAVARALGDLVDLVVDGGEIRGRASAVVNVAVSPPVVERAGEIGLEELANFGVEEARRTEPEAR